MSRYTNDRPASQNLPSNARRKVLLSKMNTGGSAAEDEVAAIIDD
jgi:hypothetical protein